MNAEQFIQELTARNALKMAMGKALEAMAKEWALKSKRVKKTQPHIRPSIH